MTDFINFLQGLFSADGFPARWVCGQWTPFHGWLYIVSNIAIWLAYFAIPVLLYIFIKKKNQVLPFGRIFWFFIIFIFACGLTHLSDSIMFWYPAYRVSAMLLFFTAIASWAAVVSLFRLLPQLFSLKSPEQVEAIIQKRFEALSEKLRVCEERWQFALEGSQLGVWDWDRNTNEMFVSKRWTQILGYEEQEISPHYQEWESRVHPDDKNHVLAEIEKHLSGQAPPYKIEHRVKCKNNKYKWMLISGMVTNRCPEGRPVRVVGTLEDIHANKVFQERMRLSENTFSSAFHFSGIGMAFVSTSGKWLDVNPSLTKLLGYTREEMLQKKFQDMTYPDDLEMGLTFIKKLLQKEVAYHQTEKRYIHKNGQVIWTIITVSVLWETETKPRCFITQIVDITKTKYLISALEQNNQKLQITGLDLESKIKQLEEFSKIVAHNLRGPASNIYMLLGMLPTNIPEINDNIYYKMLLQANVNLKSTLDDLMKVIEVRMNREIPFDACQVSQILEDVLVTFKAQIVEKDALIEHHLEVPVISYPKIYLESIFYNLISNALKYSRPGVNPHIEIHTYIENGRFMLKVKDNGMGINLERHGSQVFRFKKTFHSGYDSKGIGLFMTKNQIETFGGNIFINSDPAKGSEFIVKL